MLHVAFYDIADPNRMKKVSRLCLDYGVRMQYSVFAFDLTPRLADDFLKRMTEIICPAEDNVIVMPVCAACRDKMMYFGKAEPYVLPEFFDF